MRRFSWIASWIVWASFTTCAAAAPSVGPTPVAAALDRLEVWLGGGPYAAGWRDYLHLDALRNELQRRDAPDLDVLESTLNRLAIQHQGLELRPFVELRAALEGWLAHATLPDGAHLKAVTDSLERRMWSHRPTHKHPGLMLLVAEQKEADAVQKAHQDIRNQLTTLRVLLVAYAHDRSPWLADEIGATLDGLAATGKAGPLVAAVRDYYGHPNVWIDVSERALASGVEGSLERTIVVEDSILGTTVRGHGRTKATKKVRFSPHAERAILTLEVSGTIDTTTVGHNGPARIHGRARTAFRAQKNFWLDETGIKGWPTVCTAETTTLSSDVHAASRGLRGRIVKRVAQRQVEEKKSEADRIAARHAEDQIRALVDREASDLVSQLDRCTVAPLLAFAKGSAGAIRFRFCSDAGLLRIGVVMGPLGAPPGEPKLPLATGVALRWHETMTDRMMQYRWAKMLLASVQPENPFTAGLGSILPASLVRTAGSWSHQLARATGAASAPMQSSSAQPEPPLSAERLEDAVEQWLNRWLDPGIAADGIALREGRLGTIAPGGPDSEWMSIVWRSPAPPGRLAQQPRAGVE